MSVNPTPNPAETAPQPTGDGGLPAILNNLQPHEAQHFRRTAMEYGLIQDERARLQESEVAEMGVNVNTVAYDDPFSNPEDRAFVDSVMETMLGMRLQPEYEGMRYEGNRTKGPDTLFTQAFKELSPALSYWRENLVPKSAALSVLYRPDLPMLPGAPGTKEQGGFTPGVDNDPVARAVFAESLDGRAIRSRGDAVRNVFAQKFMDTEAYPDGSTIRIASLACGAAEIVFEATAELARSRPDLTIQVSLVDADPYALQLAEQFANSREDLANVDFTFHEANILSASALEKVSEMTSGQGFDFMDIVGFLEYLPSRTAKRFMSMAYDMLGDGGSLCAANMRDTHAQLDFTENCVRWPYIVPRPLSELLELTMSACSVSADEVSMVLPQDGAYALVGVAKPVSPRS